MIHEIGKELQTQLRAQGCPLPVVDGPEPPSTSWVRERVVIEYGTGFSFESTQSQHLNPKQPCNFRLPGKVTIYAKSSKAGALFFEHQRRALLVARQVTNALIKVFRERKNPIALPKGDFVPPADLEKSDSPGGACFAMTFEFLTGNPDVTFAGEAADEATIGADTIQSTDRVRFVNGAPGSGDTAC